MGSRIVLRIVALTIVLAGVAAAATYSLEAVTPALAFGALAAVLAASALIVAGVALGRQQGVVSEQTSLAVLVDKSLVRMGRRIDEQEVKFAAARAISGRRDRKADSAVGDGAAAQLPRADTDAIEATTPRTTMDVAGSKTERAQRERHKAKFLPPTDLTTVDYEDSEKAAELTFGRDFQVALEPVVAIPAGNITAYRVFAGFSQPDGSYAHVAETPPGYWTENGPAFGEALVAGTVAIAKRHFDMVGDARLFMPVPAAVIKDERALRALAKRYSEDPTLARVATVTIRISALQSGGADMDKRVTALAKAGIPLALEFDDPAADIAALADRLDVTAILANVELFPSGDENDWLEAVMRDTDALVIATGVGNEASVIAMMDLNVGHMSGSLFAEPKRLKASEAVSAPF